MGTTIGSSSTSLAYQCPTIREMEQAWESITTTIVRLISQLSIHTITLFVAWFGLSPTCFRTNLRSNESGGSIREVKACSLAKYQGTLLVAWTFLDTISESHIVIAHHKGDSHLELLLILKSQHQLVGLVVNVRSLDITNIIMLLYNISLATNNLQSVSKVANAGIQSQI